MNGFVKFVVRGNVIGLAVGVVIGAAFAAMVTSFTTAFLTPLIGWATGGIGDYSKKVFTLGKTPFPYGTFVNAGISFLLTAATLYFLIVLPVNKLTEELNPHHDLSHAKRSCPECLQQIPARARRCSYCTSTVAPILDEDSPDLTDELPGEIALRSALPEMRFGEPAAAAEAKPV
ncbi:large conductance mechanosensitive channel protein [Catenulispora acidiphila DSM 44928]|uniref:Large conductance mechanosensitive channel protein n=1 Tax=Catenulispora acidiphila (strain DSM 44928 / JCM 14897 / NBRC 102108 / NRRL B-24433 / ID139908) TaxID=479433 RepID=C7QC56_CATAD|nr:MscL family protein [Catenulispora acidiphila]ACU74504.1 large conductance mechanosensitive channel protein [Catenulispora acidiphila DSM 44928]